MKDVIRKVKVEANKDLKLEVYMQMDMKSLDQVVVAAKGVTPFFLGKRCSRSGTPCCGDGTSG